MARWLVVGQKEDWKGQDVVTTWHRMRVKRETTFQQSFLSTRLLGRVNSAYFLPSRVSRNGLFNYYSGYLYFPTAHFGATQVKQKGLHFFLSLVVSGPFPEIVWVLALPVGLGMMSHTHHGWLGSHVVLGKRVVAWSRKKGRNGQSRQNWPQLINSM